MVAHGLVQSLVQSLVQLAALTVSGSPNETHLQAACASVGARCDSRCLPPAPSSKLDNLVVQTGQSGGSHGVVLPGAQRSRLPGWRACLWWVGVVGGKVEQMVDGRDAVSPADESIDDDLYRIHGAGAVATSPIEAVVEDEDGSRPGLGQCVTGDPVRGGLEHLQGVAELSGDDLQSVSAGDSPERGDAQQPRWPVQRGPQS